MKYKRKIKIKFKRKLFFSGFLFLFLILGLTYLLIFSPFLKIKNINIKGTEKISQEEILNLTKELLNSFKWQIIPQNNIVIFPDEKLKTLLYEKFPAIKEVKIVKKIPSSLLIEIKEREKTLIWCGQMKCFYLDQDGLAFEEGPEIYGGMILTLKDNSGRQIETGDKVISQDLISFLLKTNELISKDLNLILTNFRIDSYPVIDVIGITSENWQIFFDASYDPKSQVEALKQVLEEKIKDKRSQLEYIDLRIENRVYYKQ